MKKVLITGFTKGQCDVDYTKTQLQVVPSEYCLHQALLEMGYEVHQRQVVPGEDLSEYTHVLVYILDPGALHSRCVYGSLWALRERPDAIVGINDWRIDAMFAQCQRYFVDQPERIWSQYFQDNSQQTEAALKHRKELEEAQALFAGEFRWPVLISALETGDHSLLQIPAKKIMSYDPTAYTVRYGRVGIWADRDRKWLSPSLSDKSKWLKGHNFKWEVEEIGVRKKEQRRVIEKDLCAEMETIWGVLSPPHPHEGSGWWRARWHQSADAGCICVCSDKEARVIGPAHLKATVDYVEGLDDYGLEVLADEQAQDMVNVNMTKDQVRTRLAEIFP